MKAPADKDSVMARYMEGPELLRRTLADLNEADLDTAPAEGGWTIRQIVHHIADGDDLWKTCIKQALGNEEAEFTLDWYRALSQDNWADHWAYAQRPVDVSLALLKAARDHVMQLLEHVADGWNKSAGFREPNGEIVRVPVGFIIEMQADHVLHHIKRIKTIVNQNRA
jgi:uncharacterized damage-inducible protein DinB